MDLQGLYHVCARLYGTPWDSQGRVPSGVSFAGSPFPGGLHSHAAQVLLAQEAEHKRHEKFETMLNDSRGKERNAVLESKLDGFRLDAGVKNAKAEADMHKLRADFFARVSQTSESAKMDPGGHHWRRLARNPLQLV